MITNGYSERSGDVHCTMMNNWSDDPEQQLGTDESRI